MAVDIVLSGHEARIAEIIVDRLMLSQDVGHQVEGSVIVEDLQQPHGQKIHALTITNFWKLN